MFFSLLLTLFLVITPIFGKSIDFQESIILYGIIILFFIFSKLRHIPLYFLSKKFILFESTLIILYIISSLFSKNIGFSYYSFFRFIFSLTLLNLCLCNLNNHKLSKFVLLSSMIYGLIFILNKFNLVHLLPRSFNDNFILQIWGHSYLADFIIIAIPITVYKLIYKTPTSLKSKLLYLLSLIFLLTVIILTNSRSAIVSLIIGITFLVIPKIRKIYKPLFYFSIVFAIALFINQILYFQKSSFKSIDGNRLEYWQQALRGFIASPLVGNGPNNFFYINKKYESQPFSNTNYAHNYFLESLALNGIFFTLIFFGFIAFCLKYQFHHQPLNFAIGIITLSNTLLDPAWNSFGIFCLSLFYIFSQNPLIVSSNSPSSSKRLNYIFSSILIILATFYYLSKTAADILYINNHQESSLHFDPFNLDNPLSLDSNHLNFTLAQYSHDIFLFQELTNTIPLPQSEGYYYQLFSLSPKENLAQYSQLANYYLKTNQQDKLISLLSLIKTNISPANYSQKESIPLAQIYYQTALTQWNNKQFEIAIINFQNALNFSKGWAYFYIELANAYWNSGQKQRAVDLLQIDCQKAQFSQKDCQKYYYDNQDKFPTPGNKQSLIALIDTWYLPLSTADSQQVSYYRQLIKTTSLPQSENYFYLVFQIDPRRNFDLYFQLANYYYTQNQFDKLTKLLSLITNNIETDTYSASTMAETLPLAKIFYHFALIKFEEKSYDSAIYYFQEAIRFSKDWIDLRLELANAFWSIDKKDLAKKQLDVICQENHVNQEYCRLYLKLFPKNLPLPGRPSLIEKIDNLHPYAVNGIPLR